MNLEKFIEIVCDNRISLDALFILEQINIGNITEEVCIIPKIGAIVQMLERKEIIDANLSLTYKGNELLSYIKEEAYKKLDEKFSSSIHKHLKSIIQKNTGKSQAIMSIYNSRYYFLCSEKDLGVFLDRFKKKYPELWDEDKIKKCLERFVNICTKKESYPMLVQYYILHKDRGSNLATDVENFQETEEENEFKRIDSKTLF